MKLLIRFFFGLGSMLVLAVSATAFLWATQRPVTLQAPEIDFIVDEGSSVRSVAQQMNRAGIIVHPEAFVLMARLSGYDTQLKAGAYAVTQGDTPWAILERLAQGDMRQVRITLLEGWTYQRIREALRDDPNVRQTLGEMSDAALLQQLGSSAPSPEGLFYPDTYAFVPGTTDVAILQRAYRVQQQHLQQLWEERAPDLPLENPFQALILASIIEKETGRAEDRQRVAGVFVNRLRLGMLLQTDPTVIYGMGDTYQGRIRRRDLQTDTPWNTYTRRGLPPTPIATPSKAALLAALHPEAHDFLYFVARGDGSSQFSRTLAEHNLAVARYILRRAQ